MKKNILIIVENLSVPFDTRVWKQAQALRAAGYGVTVLCPRDKRGEDGYEYPDGVHIYRHPVPCAWKGAAGYLLEYGAALGMEMLYAWWIYLRRGFAVIQGCNPPDDIFLIALPFRIFGVLYIFDQHDAALELYRAKFGRKDVFYRIQAWLERMSYRTARMVMTTNESFRAMAMLQGGRSADDVVVVRNGPDTENFCAVEPNAEWKNGRAYLVGYVGNMGTQDGLDLLIEIAARLKKMGRGDIQFVCVGDGPELSQLIDLASEKQVNLSFVGRKTGLALREILSTADVCVSPDPPCGVNDISTMIKVMEYMALGKPIVQFDLKEGRYSAGEASLYATGEDAVGDFAAKIAWLIDHPDVRARMGAFGRERVEKELAWRYSVQNLLSVYERVLGE